MGDPAWLAGYIINFKISHGITSFAMRTTFTVEFTESGMTEPGLVWIAAGIIAGVIILRRPLRALYMLCYKDRPPSTDHEEAIPINQGPINNESCQDYRLKAEIDSGGKKTKSWWSRWWWSWCWCWSWCWKKKNSWSSKDNFFSSLRLVAVAGDGDLVTLDNDAIRVVSKEYKKKKTFEIWRSVLDDYTAMATSKRQDGEVLVALKRGKISWRDNSNGREVELDSSYYQTLGKISDMAVDDVGTIYVADIVNDVIYSHSLDGSFKSSFAVGDSPKCISASEDGILYVLSGSKVERGKEYDIEGGTIKKFRDLSRQDYDIKCPTDVNIVTTGLKSSKTSVYVLTKKAGSEEGASAILEFSATDGKLQRRIIDDWPGILGMVFIRGDDELAFFDSKEVKVYERQKTKRGCLGRFIN